MFVLSSGPSQTTDQPVIKIVELLKKVSSLPGETLRTYHSDHLQSETLSDLIYLLVWISRFCSDAFVKKFVQTLWRMSWGLITVVDAVAISNHLKLYHIWKSTNYDDHIHRKCFRRSAMKATELYGGSIHKLEQLPLGRFSQHKPFNLLLPVPNFNSWTHIIDFRSIDVS